MTNMYSSGEYARKQPTFHVEDAPWKARHICAMLEKHGLQPARVVDVGCGAGAILKELQAALDPETVFEGYDIAPEGIDLARQHENERLRFFCDDIAAIPDGRFDLALCIDVFEHVEDYLGFLQTLRDKGTYKLFHIPLDMTVLSVLKNSQAYTRRAVGHLHYFSPDTALLTLQYTGYEIVDWRFTPARIDQTTTRAARLLKVPRRLAFSVNQWMTARILGGYSMLVLTR